MEVMIAVFVLSVGLVGVGQLIFSSLRHSIDSRDHIIASQLAQEGIELVRNIRDNNRLSEVDIFLGLTPGDYRIDYNDDGVQTAGLDYSLKYTANFYDHGSGSATKFARKIKIENYSEGEARKITSVVSWKGAIPETTTDCTTANKCIYIEDILTNW